MERSDWQWAHEAIQDNRCTNEFAREAAARCEALRKQRDELAEVCPKLVHRCSDPLIAETIAPDQTSAFRQAACRAEE